MKRILVWDLPVRLFHWLLAGAFVIALALATLSTDDSPSFGAHMIVGLVIAFMVALRVVWGFIGTRYARFRAFLFGPRETAVYFRDVLGRRGDKHYVGHNPGSSWAIYALLALLAGTAFTGWQTARGSETFEDAHQVLAWSTAAVAALHVLGALWHVLRTRDNVVAAMVTGRKEGDVQDAIRSSRPWSGLAFLLLTGWWTASLFGGYDAAARTLRVPVTGTTLQLGEQEQEIGHEAEVHHEEEDEE